MNPARKKKKATRTTRTKKEKKRKKKRKRKKRKAPLRGTPQPLNLNRLWCPPSIRRMTSARKPGQPIRPSSRSTREGLCGVPWRRQAGSPAVPLWVAGPLALLPPPRLTQSLQIHHPLSSHLNNPPPRQQPLPPPPPPHLPPPLLLLLWFWNQPPKRFSMTLGVMGLHPQHHRGHLNPGALLYPRECKREASEGHPSPPDPGSLVKSSLRPHPFYRPDP